MAKDRKKINLLGKKIGCLIITAPLDSIIDGGGTLVSMWQFKCTRCGHVGSKRTKCLNRFKYSRCEKCPPIKRAIYENRNTCKNGDSSGLNPDNKI
jgi:hypothetical protein